jgi:hypothetical protein
MGEFTIRCHSTPTSALASGWAYRHSDGMETLPGAVHAGAPANSMRKQASTRTITLLSGCSFDRESRQRYRVKALGRQRRGSETPAEKKTEEGGQSSD